jgi:hypothetical protein
VTDYKCTSAEAVVRAMVAVQSGKGEYQLGTGNYNPPHVCDSCRQTVTNPVDEPWTASNAGPASDCAGFAICYCWKLVRHRPGFNKGAWSTVEDDINVNSIMEDAVHKQELCHVVDFGLPMPGDLLCYPTFKSGGHQFIGHVGIVVDTGLDSRVVYSRRWDRLKVAQCHGPNGFQPGAVLTDGSIWLHHDAIWPTPLTRTQLIRMKERK